MALLASKRHRRHSVFECVRPCESVRLCVRKNFWTPYIKNRWREFHSILVTDVFGFMDVSIRFCGQRVKGQGHSRRRHTSRSSFNQVKRSNIQHSDSDGFLYGVLLV